MLSLLSSFLNNRFQKVVLNGKSSELRVVKAGVPQGSILGPLLFLIYVNDIPDNLDSNVKLFADDTAIFCIFNTPNETANELMYDFEKNQKLGHTMENDI